MIDENTPVITGDRAAAPVAQPAPRKRGKGKKNERRIHGMGNNVFKCPLYCR